MAEQKKINEGALFADETAAYRSPGERKAGDVVTCRFRTKKDNVKAVYLVGRAIRKRMEKAETRGDFDFYETSFTMPSERFYYCFEIEGEGEKILYDRLGADRHCLFNPGRAFRILPGFSTPEWTKGAVMYQIFVDRFYNGDPDNDVLTGEYAYLGRLVERVTDWNARPETEDTHRFYGGDLKGVLKKLDYLQHLGIEVIYLNPIFVSPSNHKYDSQDYDYVDPHLTGFPVDEGDCLPEGSLNNRESSRYLCRITAPRNLNYANAFFAHLCDEIHKRGMKIIIDGVFNHCGSFHKWMDSQKIYDEKDGYAPGAFEREDSPYHDFFFFEPDTTWPDNENFIGWWSHPTLPKLNYEKSRELHDYMMGIAKKWVSQPYNADGWRLDVAADLGLNSTSNHEFWRDFRKAVKEANPEAVIIAEHYGDPEHWLRGDQWDTVMNYDAFMEPVSYFLTGMEKHSDDYDPYLHGNGKAFFKTLTEKGLKLPTESLYSAMNELSNHDHSRFLTRTNRSVGRLSSRGSGAAEAGVSYATFREGVVMQFTLPGAPTIYYGDETGVFGWTDPDSRRTFPWGQEHWDLIQFHRDMILLHRKYSCFKTGSFKPLQEDYGYVAYGRFDRDAAAVILINHSEQDRAVSVPVSELEIPENAVLRRVMRTNDAGYNVGVVKAEVQNGRLTRTITAWSSEVYIFESENR